jgi:hypothetical protein
VMMAYIQAPTDILPTAGQCQDPLAKDIEVYLLRGKP